MVVLLDRRSGKIASKLGRKFEATDNKESWRGETKNTGQFISFTYPSMNHPSSSTLRNVLDELALRTSPLLLDKKPRIESIPTATRFPREKVEEGVSREGEEGRIRRGVVRGASSRGVKAGRA